MSPGDENFIITQSSSTTVGVVTAVLLPARLTEKAQAPLAFRIGPVVLAQSVETIVAYPLLGTALLKLNRRTIVVRGDDSRPPEDALANCEERIEELKEENAALRKAALSFGELAERLNDNQRLGAPHQELRITET